MVRIKSRKYQSIGKDVEQLEFSYTAGGNINSYKHLGDSLVEPTEVIYTYVHNPVSLTIYGPSSAPCPISMSLAL